LQNIIISFFNFFQKFGISKEILTIVGILSIFLAMIVPLPSYVLDFFLILSLSVSILILLISVYIKNPTSLTMFPTLILVVTLFRLSLNVASTKAILSKGHEGADQVSKIITAFGDFVVGGDFVIGLITFIILVLINFMVITKGSTRVAEVSARFALDSLPGKQMAIDADLQAGVIDDEEATKKRKEMSQQASFYGSMDGASKFVKGDAIAGIIITFINIIGGILIGSIQHGMDISTSVSTYTLLTIGDGLSSQIPAFLLSMAVGIMLTRSSEDNEKNFSLGILQQMSKEYSSFLIVSSILFLMIFIPGFPVGSLLLLSSFFFIVSFFIYRGHSDATGNYLFEIMNNILNKSAIIKEIEEVFKKEEEPIPNINNQQSPENISDNNQSVTAQSELFNLNMLELRVGYNLAKEIKQGFLIDKLKGIKKKIVNNIGIIIPKINISDDKLLKPNEYKLFLKGIPIGGFEIMDNRLIAFPSKRSAIIENSILFKDPNYSLDAYWITSSQKNEALLENYTIIDTSSFIATHIYEVIIENAGNILSRDDISILLEEVKKYYPVVVEEAMKNSSFGIVLQVLKQLLEDKIPVTDIVTILETIADKPSSHFGVDDIVAAIRVKLSRNISEHFSENNKLHIIIFDNYSSEKLEKKIITDQQGNISLSLEFEELNQMVLKVKEGINVLQKRGIKKFIFVANDANLRKELNNIFKQLHIDLSVFIYEELDLDYEFEVEETIKLYDTNE